MGFMGSDPSSNPIKEYKLVIPARVPDVFVASIPPFISWVIGWLRNSCKYWFFILLGYKDANEFWII